MAASDAGDSARIQFLDTVCDLAASQYGAHLLIMHCCSPVVFAQILSSLEKTGSCSVHAGKALGTHVWCHMLSEAHPVRRSQGCLCILYQHWALHCLGAFECGCASRLGRQTCSLLHCLRRFLCMQVELAEEDSYPL